MTSLPSRHFVRFRHWFNRHARWVALCTEIEDGRRRPCVLVYHRRWVGTVPLGRWRR